MPSYSDFKYLQKVNAKCPQISDEKKNDHLKLGSKVIYQRGKTFFFHQKSEGILHLLFAGT